MSQTQSYKIVTDERELDTFTVEGGVEIRLKRNNTSVDVRMVVMKKEISMLILFLRAHQEYLN